MKDPRRELRSFRRKAEQLKHRAKANAWPCWVCGEPIDYSLDYRAALAFTADHVAPIAAGGPILGDLKPAHRGCNARRGDGTRAARLKTTRAW